MDGQYKKHILKNIDKLIQNTKYDELITACENHGLISGVMRGRIDYLADAKEYQKHKELFIKLTKRGPTAYETLITILINLEFSVAANILHALKHDDSQYISMHNRVTNNPVPNGYHLKDTVDSGFALVPEKPTNPLIPPFTVKKKSDSASFDKVSKLPCYDMKSRNRGVLLTVNIIDFPTKKKRSGAEKDAENLLYLFQEFGFTCFSYTNLTRKEFFEVLAKLCISDYLVQTESFVLVLMSHGEMSDNMHDYVEFYDGSVGTVCEIEDILSNINCPSLVNKPKVLVFPFCRGDTPDKGIKLETEGHPYTPATSSRRNLPTRSDILVCYATTRGFQSLRDIDEGSWYIQEFCKVLAENAHDTHLEDMLKIIGYKTQQFQTLFGDLQTPAFDNHGFNKFLFFNPGM